MTPEETTILDAANQCVKCGVCMPHCPTYQETHDENESPRGRIALMQGLVKHDLPLTEKLTAHLDHCLSCMACEAVCPSHVIYSKLIDDTKTLIKEKQSFITRIQSRILLNLISNRRFNYILHCLLYPYQKSGLQLLLRKSGLLNVLGLKRLEATLPHLTAPTVFQSFYPASSTSLKVNGQVGLFIGCLNPDFDTKTIQDAIFVLTKLGFNVAVPKEQTCCGAMHLHSGFKKQSAKFAKKNNQAFDNNISAILMLGSGCAATTQLYDTAGEKNRYVEISSFIAAHLNKAKLKAVDEQFFVHLPCTQKNVIKKKDAVFDLLNKLPLHSVQPFSTETHCCGAAGTYMIRYPDMAQELFLDLWNNRSQDKISTIVSNNIGCTLHFLAQLQDIDKKVQVIHPISVIARALAD